MRELSLSHHTAHTEHFEPTRFLAGLETLAVSEVIPHRAPMILIDKLKHYAVDTLTTCTHISEHSAYFNSTLNGVPNYVGIEYMAQSIAALAGVEAKLKQDKIRVGFLLGSRKLNLHIPSFVLGKTYHTEVKRLYQEASGLAVFDCHIFIEATATEPKIIVASANVNVFQPQDTQAYIHNSSHQNDNKAPQ